MTADSPRDYSPEAEGVRDCCANLAQTFRGMAFVSESTNNRFAVHRGELREWASRLERAVQRMDEEKASDPKFILRETAEAYNDGCADGLDSDAAHDMAMGVLAGLLGLAPEPGPLEDEKASQRP